jgi:hypothetical protein
VSFMPTSQVTHNPGIDWSGAVPISGVEKNYPPGSLSEPAPPTVPPTMSSEQVQISEQAVNQQKPMPAVMPLLAAAKDQLQAAVQGDKPLSKATQDLVAEAVLLEPPSSQKKTEPPPPNRQLPLGQASSADVLHLIAPIISPLEAPLPAPVPSDENIKVPAPSKDQIVNQTDALVKGTILTVRAIQEKVRSDPELLPLSPRPLLQGVAVSTVAPMISSGRKNLQDVISGEKTVSEAVGAVASDAMDAIVSGTVSNLGHKLLSGAASALGAPPATAEAVGMVAAFTSARLSNVVLDGTGAKMVVMDQTKNWLDRNVTGTPSPLPSVLNQGPLVFEPVEIKPLEINLNLPIVELPVLSE